MYEPKDGDILVASVRHTGTHFMLRCLGGDDFREKTGYINSLEDSFSGSLIRAHFYKKNFDRIQKLAPYMPIVIPTREKADVVASWERRGHDMESLERQWDMFEFFADKAERKMRFSPFIFPMDTKPFDALEEFLGRKVNRDTSVIRHPRDS